MPDTEPPDEKDPTTVSLLKNEDLILHKQSSISSDPVDPQLSVDEALRKMTSEKLSKAGIELSAPGAADKWARPVEFPFSFWRGKVQSGVPACDSITARRKLADEKSKGNREPDGHPEHLERS